MQKPTDSHINATERIMPEVSVELITGVDAHPETADVEYMPMMSDRRQVVRNEEMGTSVLVDTNAETNPDDMESEYWMVGYLFHGPEWNIPVDSAAEESSEEIYELARCYMFPTELDPNGHYAEQIHNLLLAKAQEGNMASEVVDFINEKVTEARDKIANNVWETLE